MLPTIEWNDEGVVMIDQRKLPGAEVYVTLQDARSDVAKAIKTMVIQRRAGDWRGCGHGTGARRAGRARRPARRSSRQSSTSCAR